MSYQYVKSSKVERTNGIIIELTMFILSSALLILFGTHHWAFTCVAFLIAASVIVFYSQIALPCLLFLVPLASIFKISPDSVSLLTLLQMIYVGYYFFARKEYDVQATKIIILTAYVIIVSCFCGIFEITTYIKLFSKLMFLWAAFLEIKEQKFNERQETLCEYAYIIGTITAILFSCLNSSFFPIRTFIEQKVELFGSEEEAIVRYSGLAGDANYFAVGVIISLCLCVLLLSRNKMNFVVFCAFFSAFFFAMAATGSKSAMIMLAWPVLLFVLSNISKGRYIFSVICIAGICIIVFLIISGKITMFNNTIRRFKKGTGGVESLTTGRTTIWLAILEYFKENPARFFFGNGASTYIFYMSLKKRAAHNAYIDLVYQLGLVGAIFFVNIIFGIVKTEIRKRNIFNYSIIVLIIVMYMFLNQFSDYEWPFHFLIASIVYNSNLTTKYQFRADKNISNGYKYIRA